MNQLGPQSPYQKYFMTYFTIHVTEMTTQKCALSMGGLPFSGSLPSNLKYDPESYLLSANDFRLVLGTFKEQENVI